jgi:hypothetical protein
MDVGVSDVYERSSIVAMWRCRDVKLQHDYS